MVGAEYDGGCPGYGGGREESAVRKTVDACHWVKLLLLLLAV